MGNANSGRRPMSVEMKRKAIIDKAWTRVDKLLDAPGKMGDIVAKDVATKDQTTRVDTNITGEIVLMGRVVIDDKPLEPKVGD